MADPAGARGAAPPGARWLPRLLTSGRPALPPLVCRLWPRSFNVLVFGSFKLDNKSSI